MADSGVPDDDFYTVLGVDDDATPDEIRAAYRERVKETHPDQSDAPDAGERFRRVKRAEEVLTDPAERARYDRLGHERYVADEAVGGARGTEGPGDATPGDRTGGGGQRGGGNRRGRDRRRGRGPREGRDHRRDRGPGARRGTGRRSDASDPGERGDRGGTGDGRRRDGGRTGRAGAGAAAGAAGATRAGGGGPAGAGSGVSGTAGGSGVSGTAGGSGVSGTASTDPVTEGLRRSVRFFDSRQLEIGASEAVFGFAAFFLYPIFLASSVAPSFPLPVNLVLALCLLLTVGYLLATPEVGTVVFGAWTLFAPVLFLFTDEPLLSWAAFFLFAATAIPLGLSLLVREVVRAP